MSLSNTFLSPSEKCFANVLVSNICKYLNNQHECNLLQVSGDLKDIVTYCIWKRKFKEVEIIMNGSDYIVANKFDIDLLFCRNKNKEIRSRTVIYRKRNADVFLDLNRNNIKKLKISSRLCHQNPETNDLLFKTNPQNLTCLHYFWVTLTNEVLQIVAENCLNLESLVLSHCSNIQGEYLVIDKDIAVPTIKAITPLKSLNVESIATLRDPNHVHTYSNIRNILSNLKLQELLLKVPIRPNADNNSDNEYSMCNLEEYKNFQIGFFRDPKDYLHFQTNYLVKFVNLNKLSLKGRQITIKTRFFNILLQFCKNINHLGFEGCKFSHFIALPNLKELHLNHCRGLTYFNLKTILSKMNLKHFTSITTKYRFNRKYKCFLFSASLQKIELDDFCYQIATLFKFNKTNFNSLTEFYCDGEDKKLQLTNFAPNLKIFSLQFLEFNFENFLKWEFLQKLDLYEYPDFKMSQFQLLLKQTNLRDLSFYPSLKMDVDVTHLNAFETNLLYLNILSDVLNEITDFILDLLHLNRKLSLICDEVTSTLICEIINNVKFPSRIEFINVCGHFINCITIKNECVDAMELIHFILDTFIGWSPYCVLE